MPTLSIEEVQSRLPEIIDELQPGDELVITKVDKPVAKLRKLGYEAPLPTFGSCKEMMTILVDDDEHLKDFADYMPSENVPVEESPVTIADLPATNLNEPELPKGFPIYGRGRGKKVIDI